MKTTFATAALTLLSGAFAAPTYVDPYALAYTPSAPAHTSSTPPPVFDLITFVVSNKYAGTSAAASVLANGTPTLLSGLFGHSHLVRDGRVFATNAELITILDGLFCIFKNPHGDVIKFNKDNVHVELDGNAHKDVQTDVSDFTIECQQ